MDQIERKRALRTFAKVLQNERPLDPGVEADRSLYVESLHIESGNGLKIDPVDWLAEQIGYSEGSRVWLFTGNIGSGKSTELRRLRKLLVEQKHKVMLVDAADYLNLNQPIAISDFLVSLTAAIAEEAGRLLGDDQLGVDYWERFWGFLTRTNIDVAELNVGVDKASLKLALKQDPIIKVRLQNALAGHVSALRRDLEEFLVPVIERLRSRRNGLDTKVVLILDSLERLRGEGSAGDSVFSSVLRMFTQYPDMLRLEGVQVVYSVAPYLIKLAPQLAGTFGNGALYHLTSAHVFKNRSRELDATGLAALREIITRRYPGWADLITPAMLDQAIEFSGGDLRDLFRLLSILLSVLEHADAPEAALAYALEQMRRDMTWITQEHIQRLRELAQSKEPVLKDEKDRDNLVHDLETKRVLMYRNGRDWYDIHPLLREFVENASPSPAAGDAHATG